MLIWQKFERLFEFELSILIFRLEGSQVFLNILEPGQLGLGRVEISPQFGYFLRLGHVKKPDETSPEGSQNSH